MKITTKKLTIYFAISMLILSLLAQSTYADDPVTISPYKLILNAKGFLNNGVAQDIQAIIGKAMDASYSITDFTVTIQIGSATFYAVDLRYCVIDENFLATFNRQEIQESKVVQDLAGSTVTVIVEGQYTATNSAGDTITGGFIGSDSVEIIDPNKK